jgi:hypothetical protein
MRSTPIRSNDDGPKLAIPATPTSPLAALGRRAGTRLLHEAREALPPTIFFIIGFDLVVLTTNLLLAEYAVAFSNFMLATVAALVVGKAVLVANAMPYLRRYDRAPLILPILYKTAFYWVIVFVVRPLEQFVRFCLVEQHPIGDFLSHVIATFSWDRRAARRRAGQPRQSGGAAAAASRFPKVKFAHDSPLDRSPLGRQPGRTDNDNGYIAPFLSITSQVRIGLSAGGNRIRTLGPPPSE